MNVATIYTATDDGIEAYNPDAGAHVGRWCEAPEAPDRCYQCFDPATLAHYPAEGWIDDTTTPGYRLGVCHRCFPVPIGGECWYWNQDQDPAREGWAPAIVEGWGGKDGRWVFDVRLIVEGWCKWGWPWQVLPRSPGEPMPGDSPAELRGVRA